MRLPATIALVSLALAAAPGRAGAQWRTAPMVVPAPAGAEVLPGRFTAASGGDELLAVDPVTGAAVRRPHLALLAPVTWPYALPVNTPIRAGRTRASNADLLADLAYPEAGRMVIRYGTAPDLPVPRSGPAGVISFAHVMPHDGDTPVFPSPGVDTGAGWIDVRDDETSSLGGTQLSRTWRADGLASPAAGAHEVLGVQLSPAAVALGVDDLALPTGGGVFLLAHRPPTPDLRYAAPPVDLYDGLELAAALVGGPSALARPPWLPSSIPAKGDALGAAAVDLDGDGRRDLVFSYGSALDVPDGAGGFLANHLVAVRGTGDPLDLSAGAWEDVTALPVLGLRDPVALRPVVVGGEPGAAVWDRGEDAVVVFWSEGGALRTWRGDAAGRKIRDLRLADVAGSAAPDLVAVGEDVLVYPDVGDASPVLAWSPGSPGAPVRGEDHLLSVTASDADGALTLEWFLGDPYGAPASSSVVAAGAGQVVEHLTPGALLCEPPPQTLGVTVRATDALGVFTELSAALPVVLPPPSLTLSSALSEGRLVLPPGGTTATFEGSARSGCGALVFTWGGTIFDAATSFAEEVTATSARRIVTLGEDAYAALLAIAEPDVTLAVTDSGAASGPVSLAVDLDAEGLVEVVHSADVPALAEGEVAILRTVIRSRLGVPLPGVRVVDLLGGLAPAGDPRVQGAAVVGTARGGAEVVLETLPGGGAEVVVELPVRSTSAGRRGASAVEVRSSGGHLLSAPARTPARDVVVPGCGCGGGGAGIEALLALGALFALRGSPRGWARRASRARA